MKITIETKVAAPIEDVWRAWTTPADIEQWNAADDSWHCPEAEIDLRPGGRFRYRMAARDDSMAFDLTGTFTRVTPQELIEFSLDDDRDVKVEFRAQDDAVVVHETFEAETMNPPEMQRAGWQAILDRFARHVESRPA
ncbi:MAG: SRPBCC family protein [Planctomycetota bacterium]